jgi:hypothetical protein
MCQQLNPHSLPLRCWRVNILDSPQLAEDEGVEEGAQVHQASYLLAGGGVNILPVDCPQLAEDEGVEEGGHTHHAPYL